MKQQEAELVNVALMQINRQLKAVYEFVATNDQECIDEFKYRFARVLGEHIMEFQTPLWDEFPDLKPLCVDGTLEVDKGIFNQSPFGDEYTYPKEIS